MAETAEQQQEHQEHQEPREDAVVVDPDEAEKKKPQPPPPSQGLPATTFNIWPPSQHTREAVINRLVETLAKESILSKRYGAIPGDEAAAVARQIEEEAFSAAAASPPAPTDASATDDLEIGTLQTYSREISKRMLSTVKARASAGSSSPPSTPPIETPPPASAAAPASSDEAPSGESETSLLLKQRRAMFAAI